MKLKQVLNIPVVALLLSCSNTGPQATAISQTAAATEPARSEPRSKEALVPDYEHVMVTMPPDSLKLDPFYRKYTDAFGIPITSSEKVPNTALLMARDIVNYMLMKRMDIREALIDRGALRQADPALYAEIEPAYEAAKAKGLYQGQYAINTVAEYWAEGSQWWFWSNYEFYDGETRVQSPQDLKAYDPTLYRILERVYPGHHIPADVYYRRNVKPARR